MVAAQAYLRGTSWHDIEVDNYFYVYRINNGRKRQKVINLEKIALR